MDQIQNSARTAGANAFRKPILVEKTMSPVMPWPEDASHSFEDFLAALTDSLNAGSTDQLPEVVVDCLERLATWFDTDRVSILELDESSGALVVRHQWLRPGFTGTSVLGVPSTPSLLEKIRVGQMVLFGNLDVDTNLDEVRPLASAGIKSTALIPLLAGQQLCGALSIASFRKHEAWDQRRISRLRAIAHLLANTIARSRSEERLLRVQSQISEIEERYQVEHSYRREETELCHTHNAVIGQSEAIRGVLRKVEQVAPMDSAVLILGETGTGKELIARTIHELSRRHDRQMIRVNCAAMPATLIESELFGREKGAYTGALSREIGRFELADRSTIFLDEIGEMPLEVQAKLLRVLQDGEFERLGSSRTIQVNARVIAATNRDLQAAVREGKFREDLYYRLNVFPIEIPPLRERCGDIPALAWHSIRKLCKQMGIEIDSIHPMTMKALQEYSWPGNVRELGNLIERYLIINRGPVFRAEVPRTSRPALLAGERLEDVERQHILTVLRRTNWRIRGKDGTAEILGVKATTLEARMKRLGITRPKEFVRQRDESFRLDSQRNIA